MTTQKEVAAPLEENGHLAASSNAKTTKPRCRVKGCPWRGTCPDHSAADDYRDLDYYKQLMR